MLNELNQALYKLDSAIEKLADLNEKDFKDELGALVNAIPSSDLLVRYQEVMLEMNEKRSNGESIDSLKDERIELLNQIPKVPELRKFKKISEYLLERLTEAILNKEEQGNKIGLIDATLKEINLRTTATNRTQVDSVEGVASIGTPKRALQDDIVEAANNITKDIGNIIIGE